MDRFKKFLGYIFEVEGGYTNDKNDRGRATNFGITHDDAKKYLGYTGDMRDFKKSDAEKIYEKVYYRGNHIDKITDDRVALSIFDWAVNSGRRGIKKAQIVANKFGANLVIDGIVGNKTLEAINAIDPEAFLKEYHEMQRTFYKNLAAKDSTQEDFLKGWLNRVEIKEKYIEKELV
nr:MAG TPA: Lysozyme [Caudoviricetes sp.]